MGIDQRVHGRRWWTSGLRLDDRRSHLRHLHGAQDEATRADWLHAEGALNQAGAVSAQLGRWRAVQPDLHRVGLSADRLLEMGRTGLPMGSSHRAAIRRERSEDLVLGSVE